MIGSQDDAGLMASQEPSFLADQGHVEVPIELMARPEARECVGR